jgi:hypothetical protein
MSPWCNGSTLKKAILYRIRSATHSIHLQQRRGGGSIPSGDTKHVARDLQTAAKAESRAVRLCSVAPNLECMQQIKNFYWKKQKAHSVISIAGKVRSLLRSHKPGASQVQILDPLPVLG